MGGNDADDGFPHLHLAGIGLGARVVDHGQRHLLPGLGHPQIGAEDGDALSAGVGVGPVVGELGHRIHAGEPVAALP